MESYNPRYSDTTLTELMIPSYANFGGKIHGGTLLSLMDKVAFAASTKHAGNYCVTVSVDGVEFLQPVEVGELVSMMARVNYVGKTSLVVGIKVTAENVKTKTVKHTNTCYFTMVAKGEDGKPTLVPELILEDDLDIKRFAESLLRKQLKAYHKEQVSKSKEEFSTEKVIDLIKDERCQISLKA
jgi:uncharacterized protein (TIGR00369 family)